MSQSQAIRRPRLFYGWVIVAAGFVGQVINTGIGFQGFGTYLVPLEREFGWSKASLAAARSLMQAESGLVEPIVGFLVDRFGPRVLSTIGMFLFGLGMVLLSLIQDLWAYYGVFVVMALGSSFGGFLVMTVAINNWFRRRRTLAMSVAQMGLGIGGIVVVNLLLWSHTSFGWRATAFWSGIAVWAIGIPMALLLRQAPEKYGLLPDGDTEPEGPVSTSDTPASRSPSSMLADYTLGEALRTPSFWLIGMGHGLSVMIVSAAAVHQFAHMEQGIGLDSGAAAAVFTVLSVASIGGRLMGGYLGDRLPKRYLSAVGMGGSAAALAFLAIATSLQGAMLYGVLHGLCWGLRGPLMSSIRGEYFGRMAFGKISGISSMLTQFFALVGPVFAGFMADLQGGYQVGFLVLAFISGAGSLTFILARPPGPPRRAREAMGLPR